MLFNVNGTLYDTSSMRTYTTGYAPMPKVYQTPDGQAIFVETVDPQGNTRIHRANAAMIELLTSRFGLTDLLRSPDRPYQ